MKYLLLLSIFLSGCIKHTDRYVVIKTDYGVEDAEYIKCIEGFGYWIRQDLEPVLTIYGAQVQCEDEKYPFNSVKSALDRFPLMNLTLDKPIGFEY